MNGGASVDGSTYVRHLPAPIKSKNFDENAFPSIDRELLSSKWQVDGLASLEPRANASFELFFV